MGWASTKEDIEAYHEDLNHMWSRWDENGTVDPAEARKLLAGGEALVRRLGELLEIASSTDLATAHVLWEAQARAAALEREVERLRATRDSLNTRLAECRAEDQRTIALLRQELADLLGRREGESLRAYSRQVRKDADRSDRRRVRRLLAQRPGGSSKAKRKPADAPNTKSATTKPFRKVAKSKRKKGGGKITRNVLRPKQ